MPNIIRNFHKDAFYHVYNRGLNKQPLFFKPFDYERFVRKISEYQQKFPSINIHAYCLLPNHFHFLLQDESLKKSIEENSRSALISEFMKGVQLSHAMYFTKQYGDTVKSGLKMPVYEGRFKSKIIFDEFYLESVKNYIDCNAWRHGVVTNPQEWPYSSYHWQSRSTLNFENVQRNKADFDAELGF